MNNSLKYEDLITVFLSFDSQYEDLFAVFLKFLIVNEDNYFNISFIFLHSLLLWSLLSLFFSCLNLSFLF